MRIIVSIIAAAVFAGCATAGPALSQPPGEAAAPVSIVAEDHSIIIADGSWSVKGSAFMHVGELQRAINRALTACGIAQAPLVVDGDFGGNSRRAVKALRGCARYAVPGEPVDSAVTVALWNRLVPDFEPPDVVDRAFMLRLKHEGTDYDRLEWNYSSVDPMAYGTWGPDGATFGRGGEIQLILSAAEQKSPGMLSAAFAKAQEGNPRRRRPMTAEQAANCTGVAPLPASVPNIAIFIEAIPLREEAVKAKLLPVFCDEDRAGVWEAAFKVMGADPRVRAAYHELYEVELRRYAVNGYAVWPNGTKPTEVDFAFILDGAVQFGPRQRQAEQRAAFAAAAPGALDTAPGRRLHLARKLFAGSDTTSGEPTSCVGEYWKQPRAQAVFCDRLGRDMAFVKGLAPLTPREEGIWAARSGVTAAELGLSDREFPLPDHFLPVMRPRSPP